LETKHSNYQVPVFIIGMILFTAVACLGWIKLQYGFNFIDEGYHATESWRLAAGDHFLYDKITFSLINYTLINSLIFKIYPDISLLQLRQLQFILALAALLLFGVALFRQTRQYAWMPFVFSLFAFTGLDTIGMISNLYYQTYSHLFLVLYISFLLFGFQSKNIAIKKILYLFSGFCLWAMSLSLLYTGLFILSPIIAFIFSRKLELKDYSFTFKDLLYVLSPFAGCWMLFIAIFNKAYILNLFNSIDVILSMTTYSGLINLNWEVLKHLTISLAFLSLFYVAIKKLPIHFFIPVCTILSFIVLLIIITSFFGCITPYHNIWYAKQMWFASLLSAFTILFWIYVIRKYFSKRIFCKEEKLSIILMIPFTISSLTMSTFSGMGELAVTQTAIPAVAAIFLFVMARVNEYELQKHSEMKIPPIPPLQRGAGGIFTVRPMKYQSVAALVAVMLLLGPFYYASARSDWNFTFFDVQPKDATVRLETGFGRGIYTNIAYSKLYDWLIANAAYFTEPNDYAISYYCAPMVHMIIRLRPSLDDTYIIIEKPNIYYEKCIQKMLERGREPRIAFIFENIPAFDQGRQLDFSSSTDPITIYVKTHMTPASSFKISDYHIIRCYVDYNLGSESIISSE
jgi:hypothetical protein